MMAAGMLVLNRDDVAALLDPDDLVEAVASALAGLSAGEASMPPRGGVPGANGGYLGVMPAFVPSAGALTTKLVTLFPGNADTDLPTHQAVIVAFDPSDGSVAAVMDGTEITATRTAAASALATRLLAREDSSVLAVLGTGVQARSHLRALPRIRTFGEIRVAGRDRAKADALVEEVTSSAEPIGPVTVAPSFEAAARGADVVCACTHAPEPVVRAEWLAPGAHVNSVGVHPTGVEVDAALVSGAAVVAVESRTSALGAFPAGANELSNAIAAGRLRPDDVVELGELILGTRSGRRSAADTTLYKSVGVAVEDAAASALVLAEARSESRGVRIDL
jgi:alanine dehydrogenase